jgi:hypothetical protein
VAQPGGWTPGLDPPLGMYNSILISYSRYIYIIIFYYLYISLFCQTPPHEKFLIALLVGWQHKLWQTGLWGLINKQMIKKSKKSNTFLSTMQLSQLKLQNVELFFLPPNMTFHWQPMDHGITQQFKKLYWKQLLQNAVADLDARDSCAINDSCNVVSVAEIVNTINNQGKQLIAENNQQ